MKTKLEMELEITQEIVDAIAEELIASGDYVPVVRCKDCKHGEIDDPDLPFMYLCHEYGDQWNDENHFCSHGERRVDDVVD